MKASSKLYCSVPQLGSNLVKKNIDKQKEQSKDKIFM